MLNLYRRHRASCKSSARRAKCFCPIWVQGVLRGESIRKSLDLTNWEAANKLIRDWEVDGRAVVRTAREAVEGFISDREAMKLSAAMMSKYRHVGAEITALFGDRPVTSITPDEIRAMRKDWKLAAITAQKRMEMVKKFFSFCVDSEWIEKSPAKLVKMPPAIYEPTLPFSDEEMEKILWAADSIREAHPKIPKETPKKLKALILLMRYSGIRISDAVMFKRDTLKKGKLFLRQEKTKHSVWVPLPDFVVKAIDACDEGDEYFFYNQVGKPKSAITEWQQRLKLVYEMAGIKDGHSHRLRDTFSVSLLEQNVSIETVSMLLGHKDIRVTQRHYAPWIKTRQLALEAAVKGTWTDVR
jgi:integrase/recombinase XerD